MVLLVYSILYGVTAKEAHWLGAITSAAVIILGMFLITLLVCNWQFVLLSLLQQQDVITYYGANLLKCICCHVDWNMGACLYGFKLLNSRVAALFVAGTSRVFLICFGVHYWFVIDFLISNINCNVTGFCHCCHSRRFFFILGTWGIVLVMLL